MFAEGYYYGTLLGGQTGESIRKGTPQITLVWKVTHAWNGEKYEPLLNPENKEVVLYFTERTEDRTIGQLNALGFNGNYRKPEFSVKHGPLQCKHEDYNGKLEERWNIPGARAKKASEDTLRMLEERWKSITSGAVEQPPVDESDGLPAPEMVPF